ncbi:PIN-like domain-containing protein [Nocardioides sp. SYSU DS0651]|uniref:PIN-like domain-containing protein n=1 Tax=Nocardioides sp. SYSU DS0651 TaxID=3415955 RepID=UPI003F4B727C
MVPMNEDPTDRGDLYRGFEAYRTHTDEELREALRTCMVVFDTNVLLNLYRYNAETRASIVDVMTALSERLWIPHQVLEEFWRNRERALADPLGQVQQTADELEKLRAAAVEQLRMWVNRAALNKADEEAVESSLNEAFASAETLLDGLVDEAAVQRARNTQHDSVLSLLEPVLRGRVGSPMSAEKYVAAVKEGNRRAEASEPPGFADVKKVNRGGEGAAGDYLVWEQVLVEASARGVPVLFVTGDVKRDWWRFEGNSARGPRVELARELKTRCGQDLFMLRPDTLLGLADAVAVSVRPGSVEDVERTTRVEDPDTGERPHTGWTAEAVETLLRRLNYEAPVQEATIRFASQNGGFVSRDDVYRIGEYDPSRQLKGFTRPVNRLAQELRDSGAIPDEAVDVLVPVYDEGTHGFGWVDGFRVPAEIVHHLRD